MAAACSQAQTAQPAKLSGARSIALVGDLVLVTSTDRNELRVLDLVPPVSIQGRQFLPAPNPLQPLSIPVLNRPTRLARDLSYADLKTADDTLVQAEGREVGGPLVYASSPGLSEISIIGATEDLLVEVARLPVSAPVTATAARFDPVSQTSVLYFATDNGTKSVLFMLPLPSPAELNQRRKADESKLLSELKGNLKVVAPYNDLAVTELLVLPRGRLAVALRDRLGKTGETLLVDTATGAATPMNFGGPVRMLMTHAATQLEGGGTLGAGARVYGLLDESACGSPACGGVVAVDGQTGARLNGFLGTPMAPIQFGEVWPVSMSIFAGVPLNLLGTVVTVPLLGVVSTSTGDVVFFDAGSLTPFDVDSGGGRVSVAPAMYLPAATAATVPYVEGPIASSIVVGEGAGYDEEITVTDDGVMPDPFVVTGSLSGPMGRTGPGKSFSFTGVPWKGGATAPALTFSMGPMASSTPLGTSWKFSVTRGFAQYSTYIDTSNTYSAVALCAVHLPGPIAFWLPGQRAPANDNERVNARLFLAFPSANGVVEIAPATVNPGPATANVFCYR
ncbi:MAG: hypothetical protein K1X64_15685 [Myxococcaceae bacterium]|nr:hypothetical protein [Myxococcaceae bacterium]